MRWLKSLFKFREQSDGDTFKPFLEHMEDLRWTIIRMAIVQVAAMCLAFYFRADLMALLKAPLLRMDPVPTLMVTGIADSLVISLELAFFAGLAVAFPFHVYFLMSFVLPALTRRERRSILPAIATGFAFFLGGVLVAYHGVLGPTLTFFWKDAHDVVEVNPMWTWRAYFSFSCWLCFGFGALCEVPVIVVVLARLGLVSFGLLRRTRPYAYTGILILAAIVAPTPDPVMFLTMAMPILLMYEACIWVVWGLERRAGASSDSSRHFSLLAFLIFGGIGYRRRRAAGRM